MYSSSSKGVHLSSCGMGALLLEDGCAPLGRQSFAFVRTLSSMGDWLLSLLFLIYD